jgi:hypothetical protein
VWQRFKLAHAASWYGCSACLCAAPLTAVPLLLAGQVIFMHELMQLRWCWPMLYNLLHLLRTVWHPLVQCNFKEGLAACLAPEQVQRLAAAAAAAAARTAEKPQQFSSSCAGPQLASGPVQML